MVAPADRRFLLITLLVFLLLIGLPVLLAAATAGPDEVFGGFLYNPIDGHTYLAKMRQGWLGEWHYQIPFTEEISAGGYINTFYLALGHLARLTGLPLVFVFHFARLLGATALVFALYRFGRALFDQSASQRQFLLLALFGSGLGWLATAAPELPPDFTIPEAYPFLAAYANPHFPLGLALQVWLFAPPKEMLTGRRAILVFLAAAALAVISSFSFPVVLVAWGFWAIHRYGVFPRKDAFKYTLAIGLGGGPVLLYYLNALRADPVLAGWSAQNLTPLPPLWQVALAFAPALLLALPGWWVAVDKKSHTSIWWLVGLWAALTPLLAIAPFELQRRFLSGWQVPLAALAVLALQHYLTEARARQVWRVVFLLALPTNFIVLLTAGFAIANRPPEIYLSAGEVAAHRWLLENAPPGALVLAGPESGLYLPGAAAVRVPYGHPFETLDAERKQGDVLAFFADPDGQAAFFYLADLQPEYIFYGPREAALGPPPTGWPVIFTHQDVRIYAVDRP